MKTPGVTVCRSAALAFGLGCLLSIAPAWGQGGELDSTFVPSAEVDSVFEMLLQPDGRVLVAGTVRTANGIPGFGIGRLNTNGAWDASFDPGTGPNSAIRAMARQSDGKLVIGGLFTAVAGTPRHSIARLNTDGTLDPAFHPAVGPGDGYVTAMAVQPDDRIVIAGSFINVNGAIRRGLARLNEDGTLDPSLDPETGTDLGIEAIALESGGRILIGGNFTQVNGADRNGVARLNTNGSLDFSFVPGIAPASWVEAMVVQPDGKILVGGNAVAFGGMVRRLARLDTNGAVDLSFNPGAGFAGPLTAYSTTVGAIEVQEDGGILVGGDFVSVDGVQADRLARLNSNGSVDVNFDPGAFGGAGALPCVCALALQPDGGILLAGNFTSINGTSRSGVARLIEGGGQHAGRLEFNTNLVQAGEAAGPVTVTVVRQRSTEGTATVHYATSSYSAVAGEDFIATSGKLTFAPGETTKSFSVILLNDARVEYGEAFNVVLSSPSAGARLGLQSSSVISIADDDTAVEFTAATHTVTESQGSAEITVERRGAYLGPMTVGYSAGAGTATPGVDFQSVSGVLTFNTGDWIKTFNVPIFADTMAEMNETIQLTLSNPSAPVLLGTQSMAVLVIAEIGAVDPGFGPGTGPDGRVRALAVQPGGTIMIQGNFSADVGGNPRPGIARLHPDGVLDADFVPEIDEPARAMAVGADGSVFVGIGVGLSTRVVRLMSDGTLDRAFITPFPSEEESPLAVQADGRLIEYRVFSNLNDPPGYVTNRLLRLHRDGSMDGSFPTNAWIENRLTWRPAIEVLRFQADGKFLVGGRFTHVGGVPRSGLARFHADGALDENFDPDLGEAGAVEAMDLLPDGRILIAGAFTNVNGVARTGMARLNADGSLDDGFALELDPASSVEAVLALPGGATVVSGNFMALQPRQWLGTILRLDADGRIDPDFLPTPECCVFSLALQSDGRVLIAGSFVNGQGTDHSYLARLSTEPGRGAGMIEFSAPAWTAEEGDGSLALTVRRTGGSNGVVTVNYLTVPGGAAATDFVSVSGVITFTNGDSAPKTIFIPLLDDAAGEDDEGFAVVLSNPIGGAQLGSAATASVTLVDDDNCAAVFRYYPLHDGDRKEFSGPPGTISTVVSSTTVNGRAAMAVAIDGEGYNYAHVGNQLQLYGGTALGYDLIFEQPIVELDEKILLHGGTQTSKGTGRIAGVTLTLTLKVTVTDAGTVTVPAGTFYNCRMVTVVFTAAVKGAGSETSKQAYVLAPGVGQIRLSSVDALTQWVDLSSGTVRGKDVRDLAAESALSSPRVTAQPQSREVLHGNLVTFQVTADGSAPLAYQWMKDGANLSDGGIVSGAAAPTLVLDGVGAEDAGLYSVEIVNAAGCVSSMEVALAVLPDATRPTLTITAPAANARLSNAVATIRGQASDNARVTQVAYQLNAADWAVADGTTNWEASVALQPGTNVFRAYAIDPSGNASLTNSRVIVFVVTSPLNLSLMGSGTISPLTDGQVLEVGRRYTAKATPGAGNLFSNWTGGITSSSASLTFTMSSNLVLVASFVPNPFLSLKGNYTGLFYDTNAAAHGNAGFFTLKLTDKGSFSGNLQQGTAKYSFSGQFDLALAAHRTVPRRGTNEVVLSLQLAAGSDVVAGRVENTAWVSELSGYRAAFSSSNPAGTNLQGAYTLLLPGAGDADGGPAGNGFARLTVSSAGSASTKGTLGDGGNIAQKAPLAGNGQWPLYVSLYSGRGSVFGWLTLIDTPANDVAGLLLWTKPGGVAGPLHPAGFTNEVETIGSRYIAPARGLRVLDLTNAVIVLAEGNLTSPLTNDVTLSELNKITVTSGNPQKLALTMTASSGLLSGSFIHPQTGRPALIKGVILQKQDFGRGYFPGTSEGGSVFLGLPAD